MREKRRPANNGNSKQRRPRRYSSGSADNPFQENNLSRRNSQSSFRKVLTVMVIIFFTAILAILLFADNKDFINGKLGENSFISTLLSKLSLSNSSKDKPEFVFPFGPRRQNI